MKSIFKQKLLWIGLVLILLGVAAGVVGMKLNPDTRPLSRLEAAISRNSVEKYVSLYTPEQQANMKEYAALYGYFDLDEFLDLEEGYTYKLLQGDSRMTDTEDRITTQKIAIVAHGFGDYEVELGEAELQEVGGKLYLYNLR